MNSAILLVTGILSTSTALKTQSRYGLSLIFLISFFCFILFFPPSFSFFFSHLTQPSHVNHLLFSSSQTPACWSPLGNYRGIGNNLLWRLRDNRSEGTNKLATIVPAAGACFSWCGANTGVVLPPSILWLLVATGSNVVVLHHWCGSSKVKTVPPKKSLCLDSLLPIWLETEPMQLQ